MIRRRGMRVVGGAWTREEGAQRDQVVDEIEREEIRKALTELSVEQRGTIELACFGGYSQMEITS